MKKTLLPLLMALFVTGFLTNLQAQNVAVNNDGSAPDARAMLDVKSTTKGALLPRMTQAERIAITGSVPLGLFVFQTDGDRGFYYNGSALPGTPNWKKVSDNDDQFWQYASPNYLFNNGGLNIGIGTATPATNLHISDATDTALLLLDNRSALGINKNTGLYFKTGSSFTGAIKTIGTSTADARLGLFTYSTSSQNALKEAMSILDNGNIGIGNISPTEAGLVVDKKVGAVHAVFGSDAAGVAIESNFPGIGFNSFYNGSRKQLQTGYAGWVGLDPGTGDFYLQSSTASLAAGAAVLPSTRLFINKLGNIGIEGNTNPQSPLSFANTTGEKINFYEVSTTANYGIGVQGAQFQIYTGGSGDAISFGYGSSAAFTERVRMQNAYTIINKGRLQFKGSMGTDAHGIEFTNNAGTSSRSFIGMLDDNTMGFYGFPGAGWNFLWDVNDGSLRIGTSQKATGYMLNVGGKAIAEEVRVQLRASWPDYVFKKNYNLMPLSELEAFVKTNNHLPNIPKAEKLEKEGTDLGEMQRRMMEKIEELTLYVIAQDKKIQELERKLDKKVKSSPINRLW